MGRRKIAIEPITDERNRTVTFIKRKSGLFKKAYELAVLCQIDLTLVVMSPEGRVYEYSTGKNAEEVTAKCRAAGPAEVLVPISQDNDTRGHGRSASRDEEGSDEGSEPEIKPAVRPAPPVTPAPPAAAPPAHKLHSRTTSGTQNTPPSSYAQSEDSPASISSKPRLKVQIPGAAPGGEGATNAKSPPESAGSGGESVEAAGAAAAANQAAYALPYQFQQLYQQQYRLALGYPQGGPFFPQQMAFPYAQRLNQNQRNYVSSPGNLMQGYPVNYQDYFNQTKGYGPFLSPTAIQAMTQRPGATAGGEPASDPGNAPEGPPRPPPGDPAPGAPSQAPPNQYAAMWPNMTVNGAPAAPGAPVPTNTAGPQPSNGTDPGSVNAQANPANRWNYSQSPLAYFMPSADPNGGPRNEPGPMTAALATRSVNEMLTSPSNYFTMEWNAWDPQYSNTPGATPSRLAPQAAERDEGGDRKRRKV